MSIRPRNPGLARVRRSGQRMAPGGRRWSESPIPRAGVRRTRATGIPPVEYWLTDTSGGSTGEFWEFVPEPTLPGATGHFLVTFASTETSPGLSYGSPPGDANAIALLDAGPYTAGTPYATVTVTTANAGLWLEAFGFPLTSAQWIPE